VISRGNARGSVTLQVKNGVFWVKIVEDPKGEDLIACFREARQSNLLSGPMPTIVDMLGFNGSIDWTAIGAIREMVSWEHEHRPDGDNSVLSRCAYISADPLLAPVIKIICDLFGRTRHRQFRNPEQAALWVLHSEAPAPGATGSGEDC
jgi:hypothetical protein